MSKFCSELSKSIINDDSLFLFAFGFKFLWNHPYGLRQGRMTGLDSYLIDYFIDLSLDFMFIDLRVPPLMF